MAAADIETGRMCIKEKVKLQLRKFDIGDKFSNIQLPKASVLIPLMVRDGKLCLLFTLRSMKLRTSPGEVCFPGGRSDPTDTDEVATALREAREEVGLLPEQVEVICRLVPGIDKVALVNINDQDQDMSGSICGILLLLEGTIRVLPQVAFLKGRLGNPVFIQGPTIFYDSLLHETHSVVTPVVAFIEDTFQAQPNPEEVSHVFSVPLKYFIRPEKHRVVPLERKGQAPYLLHFFEYNDPEHQKSFTVWGLTAHFAAFVAVAIYGEKPTFEVEFDLDNLISSAEKNFMMRYHNIKGQL